MKAAAPSLAEARAVTHTGIDLSIYKFISSADLGLWPGR